MQLATIWKQHWGTGPVLDAALTLAFDRPPSAGVYPSLAHNPKSCITTYSEILAAAGCTRTVIQWSAERYLITLIFAIISWVIYQGLYRTGNKSATLSLFEKKLCHNAWLWFQVMSFQFIRLVHCWFGFVFQLGTPLYCIQTWKSTSAPSKAMLPPAPAKVPERLFCPQKRVLSPSTVNCNNS